MLQSCYKLTAPVRVRHVWAAVCNCFILFTSYGTIRECRGRFAPKLQQFLCASHSFLTSATSKKCWTSVNTESSSDKCKLRVAASNTVSISWMEWCYNYWDLNLNFSAPGIFFKRKGLLSVLHMEPQFPGKKRLERIWTASKLET